MARVKRGTISKRRHKKTLKRTQGYRMTRSRLIKVATEASLHAGEYAFAGRRRRKRDMRRTWIRRINSQLQQMDLQYSRFNNALKKANIQMDRKMLADLAINEPEIFQTVVDQLHLREN